MIGIIVILGFVVVIAVMLGAGWLTERRRRVEDPTPTLTEHAAADAGRMGSVAGTGPHDAVGLGAPTMLDAVDHELPDPAD